MKRVTYILALILVVGTVSSCEQPDEVEQKKAELTKKKDELFKLKSDISQLEKELEDLGAIEKNSNLALVSTLTASRSSFEHKMDVRGTVRSRNNIMISAEVGGTVREVRVVEGQQVKRGQILIVQDAEVLLRSIKELESSLELATNIYTRQKKLWESNIGTEVQYLEAKNNKESLELKLATTRTELSKTRVKAPFSGVIDMVDIRAGEIAQPGLPIVRLVSLSRMYIKADVSESLVGRFKKGQSVEVYFPSTEKRVKSSISAIGQVINPQNRTFEIEVRLTDNLIVKPNMTTVITLTDYQNPDAVAIPTRMIQTDRRGKFVYAIQENETGTVAIRKDIITGVTYDNQTEIKQGLTGGEVLVDKGGMEVADGALVKVSTENS